MMNITCQLEALTSVERERLQSLRTELSEIKSTTRPLPDGYSFEYTLDAVVFLKVAEWITLERRCCPFLAFELQWRQGEILPIRMAITGPPGTKDFLAAELPAQPASRCA